MGVNQSVAVIGLGLMGSRMAAQLRAHGFHTRGYDPDPDRSAEFAAAGGEPEPSPVAAVAGCGAALLSLPNSDISKTVCLGEGGLIEHEGPLDVFDATTGRPADAVAIAESLSVGDVVYCDATVSGNGEVAGRGELVVMVGGPADAYERGKPVFEAIGRSHHHVGGVGAGATMKLIVNHALTIHRMALAEVLVVAEMSGLDLEATLDVLKDGLAYSKAMDAWGERMIAADHEPPFARLRQSHKDARLIVEHAAEVGAPAALVEVVRNALAEGEDDGLADLDNSSIVEVVRRRAGRGRVS